MKDDWVKNDIESRVDLGREWRKQLGAHKELAKASCYVRIQGRTFRPVSISDMNPCGHLRYEKGDKQIPAFVNLDKAIKQAQSARDQKPRGDKPEHRIQAFLIRDAIQNDLNIEPLLKIHPDLFDQLIFIADEIRLNNGKVRADIVALAGKEGRFFPVFIELKIKRQLSVLKKQLNDAHDLIWKNEIARDSFSKFLSSISGVETSKIDKCACAARKMIIWPKSPSGKEGKEVQKARNDGFLIVEFEPAYTFSRKTSDDRSKDQSQCLNTPLCQDR